jgi:translation initiation factor 2 gamma subunit (eIF-2gamma)
LEGAFVRTTIIYGEEKMMKTMATAVMLAAVMAGAVSAAETEMPAPQAKERSAKDMPKMPMKEMVKSIKADKDGMVSMQQVMDMERERISKKMKEMGMKGDKMAPAEWEKLYDQLYRGI